MKKKLCALLLMLLSLLFAASALADGENLCVNGDFSVIDEESELPADWYIEAWYDDEDSVSFATVTDGEQNLLLIQNLVSNDARLCQAIAVSPDTYYELSCDICALELDGEGAGANISVVDSLATSESATVSGGYEHVTLVGKTGEDQTELIVALRVGGYGLLSEGSALFKNVSVRELSGEPEGTVADFSAAETGSGDSSSSFDAEDGKVPYLGLMLVCALALAIAFVILQHRCVLTEGKSDKLEGNAEKISPKLIYMLFAAFLIRCVLSVIFVGHSTDIACFASWSSTMAEVGPGEFYTVSSFADYPPGYMYVLWLVGVIEKLFGLSYGSAGYLLLLKLPAIMADLALAYLTYRIAAKRLPESKCLLIAALILLHPAIAFVSGGWGQIDSVLALLLVGTLLLFINHKKPLAGLLYGLAVLCKPQALMLGPLLAVMFISDIPGKDWKKELLSTVLSVVCALGVIFLLALPFGNGLDFTWLFEKYFSTATSYPYASVEAFNLFALFGGNWAPVTETLLGLSYGTWGTIFIALSVVYAAVLYLKGKQDRFGAAILTSAFLIAAVFTLGHYMHERYVFPALIFLAFAFAHYRDKRLYGAFAGMSIGLLLNVLAAFVIVDSPQSRGEQYTLLTFMGSLINVVSFGYLAYAASDILINKRIHSAFCGAAKETAKETEKEKKESLTPLEPLEEPNGKGKLNYTKRDKIFVSVLTVVYAVVALVNLGSTQAPETYYTADTVGDTAVLAFGEAGENQTYHVSEIRIFGGIYEGTFDIALGDAVYTYEETNSYMYRWESVAADADAAGATLTLQSGELWINEIAFFDENGDMIPTYFVSQTGGNSEHPAENLCDEPDEVPETASYMNGMYFDELYHARTAYEHLNGITPYENSHPPLGKIFIMLGIAVFGMNAFGWRIVGTLFGIAMVPIFYAFAKRLFKRSEYALLAGVLFAFDFMHFTQTRIATIDTYGVFFILLMFYYMYRYFCMSFYEDGLKKTIRPLFLAGLFFGLGAASKWICFYAGAGLAVILFTSLGMRYLEYRRADKKKKKKLPFVKNTVITLLLCCVFYLVIPAVIYILSYLPYMLSEAHYDLEGIWDVQKFMFSYHSNLTATHPFESTWWQWPLMIRPIWYYWSGIASDGMASSISAFGNPAVWWVCTVGTLTLVCLLAANKLKAKKELFVLLVGVGANYIPWMLITRCTFIYHFFATVPFILLCTVYLLSCLEKRYPRIAWVKWAWMALCIALFIVYYPAISGMWVSSEYLNALELSSSWVFVP